jgi:mono/diheme cytochrome c family protein
VLSVASLLAVGITLTIGWRPFVGPRARPLTNRRFESTPQRLARGKYLVEAVGACMGCHAPHDWTKHDAPILAGMEGAGQFIDLKELPGHIYAPNLTPDPETGIGKWSDDALARAIREGVAQDGHTLFPLMPYPSYRQLSDEDLASIVVFLRSLPPVRNPLPPTQINFPINYLIRVVPEPVTQPVPSPDLSDPVKRGRCLASIAACSDCHTPMKQGRPVPGLLYAGGQVFEGPWGRVASANLTPDPSGIPYYDQTLFIQVMRTGYVKARPLNQVMPWSNFRNMTDNDLKAIFAYLQSLKPAKHRVDNAEPPTFCKLCGNKHGAGDKN